MAVVSLAGCGWAAGASTPAPPPRSAPASASSQSVPGETTELTYAVLPYGSAVTAAKVNATVAALERRLTAAGIAGTVSAGGGNIFLRIPGAPSSAPPVPSSPQLYFYDWERNLIVAGHKGSRNAGAGSAQLGVPEYQAVLSAARRRPELRRSDTTWAPGCTPLRAESGCPYGGWYLLDRAARRMVCPGGASDCPPARTRAALLAGVRPTSRAHVAVRVAPGTVVVQALARAAAGGHVLAPNSFYVLRDDPALTGADVVNPQQGYDEAVPGHGRPNVNFSFSTDGRHAFEQLTRTVAHRGLEAQLPGVPKEAAEQHFAVVLDGRLESVPAIDFSRYPEGLDASQGSEISGGLTVAGAHELAEEIEEASLPVRIVLRHESVTSALR